jgi:stage II sporulation protein D
MRARILVFMQHAMAQPGAVTLMACAAATLLLLLAVWSCQLMAPRIAAVEPALLPEPDIRVRIERGARSVEIGGPESVLVTDSIRNPVVMFAPLRARLSGTAVEVQSADGQREQFGAGGAGHVVFRAASAERLRVDGQAYPGAVRLAIRGDSFDVVNDVPVDDYLPGVIAKELYADWPEETYRAQAIAARSYAMHLREFNALRGRAHDIDAGQSAQAYVGHTESSKAHDAVRETRGRVLTHQGDVLRAYYASTCGGRFASARDTWPTQDEFVFNLAPPLQARHRPFACESAPLYRWEGERSVAEMSARVRSFAKDRGLPARVLGAITSIEVLERNSTGRPSVYEIRDDRGGVFEISPEHLRLACNYPASGHRRIDESRRVRSSDLEFEVGARTIQIHGRGFGHGVGMCQYCARGLAEMGYDHERMLAAFYPGAVIERVY